MFKSKPLILAIFLMGGFLIYQNYQNNKIAMQSIAALNETEPEITKKKAQDAVPLPSEKLAYYQNLDNPKSQEKKQIEASVPPQKIALRPEMQNFQESADFKEYLSKMRSSLSSLIKDEQLRTKLEKHFYEKLNQPINFENPQPPPKIKLTPFEVDELKIILNQDKNFRKEDPQTYHLLLTAAVEADSDPKSKADTLGSGLQVVAESPEEVYFHLQNILSLATMTGVSNDLLIPQLEKSLSIQKNPQAIQVLKNSIKELKSY